MVIFWLTNFGILIWHTRAGALFLFPFVNEFMFMGSVNKGHNHLIVSHGSLRFWCAGVINSIWTIVSFFSVLRSSKRWCVSMCRPTEKKWMHFFSIRAFLMTCERLWSSENLTKRVFHKVYFNVSSSPSNTECVPGLEHPNAQMNASLV